MASTTSRSWRRLVAAGTLAAAVAGTVVAGPPAAAGPGPDGADSVAGADRAAGAAAYRAVDPWIGTKHDTAQNKGNSAYGNTWPGAALPFGMTQFTPTTYDSATGDAKGGYEYGADQLRGFGMTRLSGTGCEGRNSAFDLPLLPYTGAVTGDGAPATSPGEDITSFYLPFDHENEVGSPGHYAVDLDDGVEAELTATTRTTVGRFDYPRRGAESATLLLNASGSNNSAGETSLEIDPDTRTISGYTTVDTVCGEGTYRLYFTSTYDAEPTGHGTWEGDAVTAGGTEVTSSAGKDQAGAWLAFEPGTTVTFRTGISYVSVDGAARNLAEESAGKSFAQVRREARRTWEDALGTVAVTGGSREDRTVFATALYHALLHPNVYDDVDGRYRAYGAGTTMTSKVRTLREGQEHAYVTYSGWDAFRGQMQLVALLFPQVGSDIAQSITDLATQSGGWSNWPHLGSAQNKMNGDALQSIVASLDAFGSTGYDRQAALDSMVASQSLPGDGSSRTDLLSSVAVGWLEDRRSNSASTTLDYAMADFGIAQLAGRLGDDASADAFMTRAQHWRHLVSPTRNAIVPRDRTGYWSGFDLSVRDSGSAKPDPAAENQQFDQSTGYQYQWSVPFDVAGLVDELGGEAAVRHKLDSLLTDLDAGVYGTTGAYMSNQPSMHVPWLYSWLGSPDRTGETLDRARAELFTTGPSGLPGNDDLGSLSSWYVWASIGLYPAIFGRAELLVSAPAFTSVQIRSAGSERAITIQAPRAEKNRYVTASRVDGARSTKSWLPESFARDGGTLDLRMSAEPGTWGTRHDDVPPSFDQGSDGFNAIGTTTDGERNAGAMDFSGSSLSRTGLADAGATPGATVESQGVSFTWPDVEPGGFDHWVPHGQRVDLGGARAEKLAFLGTATNGPSTGHATVVYTDGSTTDVEVTFPDWTQGAGDESSGEAVLSTDGRNTADGTKDGTTAHVYATDAVDLDETKRVDAVILPDDVTSGVMHVFAVGTDTGD